MLVFVEGKPENSEKKHSDGARRVPDSWFNLRYSVLMTWQWGPAIRTQVSQAPWEPRTYWPCGRKILPGGVYFCGSAVFLCFARTNLFVRCTCQLSWQSWHAKGRVIVFVLYFQTDVVTEYEGSLCILLLLSSISFWIAVAAGLWKEPE